MPASHRLAALSGLLAACAALAAPAPPPALTYRFPAGETLRYTREGKGTVTFTVAGEVLKGEFHEAQEETWECLAPVKGRARVARTVTRLRLDADGYQPIGKGAYDSKDGKVPDTPYFKQIAPWLKARVGEATILAITPAGRSDVVTIPDALAREEKRLLADFAADGLHVDALDALGLQGALVLPNYNAGKGKAWEDTKAVKVRAGEIITRTAYEHAGTVMRGGKRLEVILIKPHTTLRGGGPGKLKLKASEASGKAYFDRAAGRLVEMTVTTKVEIEYEADGEAVVQREEQVLTLKLKE